jgi:hypothetical protein
MTCVFVVQASYSQPVGGFFYIEKLNA